MRSHLTLRFEDDNDSTGELIATVQHGDFSGTGSAWFGIEEIRAFGQALQEQLPLRLDCPITLEGGYWTSSGDPKLEEMHLSLRVYPVDGVGTIGIGVKLATPVYAGVRPESQCTVAVELQTNYEPLRAFGHGIVAIANSKEASATLIANDA